jgi:pimeloyl-ACP methyl ester carboxylesterase
MLSRLAIALLAAACPVVPALAQSAPVAAAPALEPVITQLPHISIAATGEGPAVFLIPGLASPRAVWDGVVADLARTHRGYLVEVHGFAGGDIKGNDKPGLLDGIAADLNGYIVANKIKNPAIAGHSMGGLLAMMMGARYPQSTGSVLVVDSLPFFSLLFGPTVTVDSARPFAEQARARTLATPVPTEPVTADPGGIWSITPAGRIRVANWSNKADPRVTGQAVYEVMTTDLRPELSKIAAKPFTVLYATGAGPQAKQLWEFGYAGSPATLVPIAESWHFIMLDQPAAFQQALKDFLGPK